MMRLATRAAGAGPLLVATIDEEGKDATDVNNANTAQSNDNRLTLPRVDPKSSTCSETLA